jgi:hypothetical protein
VPGLFTTSSRPNKATHTPSHPQTVNFPASNPPPYPPHLPRTLIVRSCYRPCVRAGATYVDLSLCSDPILAAAAPPKLSSWLSSALQLYRNSKNRVLFPAIRLHEFRTPDTRHRRLTATTPSLRTRQSQLGQRGSRRQKRLRSRPRARCEAVFQTRGLPANFSRVSTNGGQKICGTSRAASSVTKTEVRSASQGGVNTRRARCRNATPNKFRSPRGQGGRTHEALRKQSRLGVGPASKQSSLLRATRRSAGTEISLDRML